MSGLYKGLCNNYQDGGPKNEPRKEKYYTIPPSQQTQISSDPPPNLPKIMTNPPPPSPPTPPTNIVNIPESFTCFTCISRCEAETNKLKKKVETIKDTIAAHDDSLFSERTGKLQTGLTYHHKFNSDTLHLISTGIQDNIAQLIEDLETASKKYKATYSIGSKTNVSQSRRKKENKRKARKRSSLVVENRKSRASVIFLSLGGTPVATDR